MKKIVFASCLVTLVCSHPSAATPQKNHSSDSAKGPHAAYPHPFSRPKSQGNAYDTWQDAISPDIGAVKVDPKRLPSRVDNSSRPEFPGIYAQKWGACGQFAAVATIFTYEMNILNGTKANTDATRFPSHFSWNMINQAQNKGSEAYHGWEVAKRIGIPTAKMYGGVRLNKIGLWPNGYHIWRDAMKYRVSGYRYSPAVTVEQLNEAKGWLYDRNQPKAINRRGGLFAMDGRMGKPPERTFTLAKGEHEAGKLIWTRWDPTGFGHGLACVGYDDQVGYDVNGDGKITNDLDLDHDGKVTLADWERGAYIVANSWGEKWSSNGRIYLLYSAMIDPDWQRGNFLGRVEVARYQPRTTLRLKLSCNERSNLRTSIGITRDLEAKAPEHAFAPELLNGWPLFADSHPGKVPMAGPGEKQPLELGVDLTSLFKHLDHRQDNKARLFLKFGTAKNTKASGRIHACSLRHYDAEGKLISEVPVKITHGDFGQTELEISATISTHS